MKQNSTPFAVITPDDEILTDQTLAPRLSVEPRTLKLWRDTRQLPFIRISGKTVRYRWSDVQNWLNTQRTVIS
jgi:hypothetical protein